MSGEFNSILAPKIQIVKAADKKVNKQLTKSQQIYDKTKQTAENVNKQLEM